MTQPEYIVLSSSENGEKTFWSKIGVGFITKDNKGISIALNALPINGKLVIKKNELNLKKQTQK